MIPKAQILQAAQAQELQPTTIEKDYVLGWILYAISQHPSGSNWVFKGGTCLKKCFFETYRFSEDLDFTIPCDEPYDGQSITQTIEEVVEWVESEAGIELRRDEITVEEYKNLRGMISFQVKTPFVGPLRMPRRSLQKIKFDLTQDEIIVDEPNYREIYHPYSDVREGISQILCYSANEILAEKCRALFERQGRARDVYDLVHISRVFREEVDVEIAAEVLAKKFMFKELPEPTVLNILDRIDDGVLRANWSAQLGHQLPVLPDVAAFAESLFDALVWWIEPDKAQRQPEIIPTGTGEKPVRREMYPRRLISATSERNGLSSPSVERRLSKVVYAARNRLCLRIRYKGIERIVEPYSLRYPKTGNTLLYVWERLRESRPTNQIKALSLFGIESVRITSEPYKERYLVEL